MHLLVDDCKFCYITKLKNKTMLGHTWHSKFQSNHKVVVYQEFRFRIQIRSTTPCHFPSVLFWLAIYSQICENKYRPTKLINDNPSLLHHIAPTSSNVDCQNAFVFNVILCTCLLNFITFHLHVCTCCFLLIRFGWCSINVFSCPSICYCCFFLDFLFVVLDQYFLIWTCFCIFAFVVFPLISCFYTINIYSCVDIFSCYFLVEFFMINQCFYLSFVRESPNSLGGRKIRWINCNK